jgi:transcriptional regulator GlxA family with amidase domain
VLAIWKRVLKAPIELLLISETGGFVHCDSDIIVKAHCNFDHAPPLDYLFICGGRGRLTEVHNPHLIAFIQRQAAQAKLLLTVCTGMFLAAEAGLLKDQMATTYWRALPEASALNHIQLIPERIVKNEKIWSAGGLSSGIDLALALIEKIANTEEAGKVQLLFEYFPTHRLYTNQTSAQNLPPYGQEKTPATLPDYIQKELNQSKK